MKKNRNRDWGFFIFWTIVLATCILLWFLFFVYIAGER